MGELVPLLAGAAMACGGNGSARTTGGSTQAADSAAAVAATPVRMATVVRGDLAVVVSGIGRTDALDVQKVRAPFIGTLDSLGVVLGDRVAGGQVIGSITSQPSEAALNGARLMLASATTPQQRRDAERALQLAKQNLVRSMLRAPRSGVVVSRVASQGDLLSAGDSIVSIATASSIVFIARVAQGDLPRVQSGQPVSITVPGRAVPLRGTVHGILPADTSAMTVPVRIDLAAGEAVPIGLFGTAHITVATRSGVPIVPAVAVLRDDVTGATRVATVTPGGRAHWVQVTEGVREGDRVEILTPPLAPGLRVIVAGQVGLPEGSPVRESSGLGVAP